MLLFWVVTGVLAAAAAGLILTRASRAAAPGADPSLALYRRQLTGIDDLSDRGLIPELERKSAYAEAARRLLVATDAPAETWTAGGGWRAILATACITPLLALGLYLSVGAPGVADQPFAKRLAGWRSTDLNALSAPEIAAVLRQVTGERPKEAEGYRLLGLAEGAAQNPLGAVRALQRGVALAPQRADLWEMLGESLVFAGAGPIGEDAQSAFRETLRRDPANPAARFYLARAAAEHGQKVDAVRQLSALIADMPAEDPRRAAVSVALASLEGRTPAGLDPAQTVAVRGMVAGLAARLKANPDDPEGWVRLVRAYAVLGETAKRDAAYATARARYGAAAQVVRDLDAAVQAEPMQ